MHCLATSPSKGSLLIFQGAKPPSGPDNMV